MLILLRYFITVIRKLNHTLIFSSFDGQPIVFASIFKAQLYDVLSLPLSLLPSLHLIITLNPPE